MTANGMIYQREAPVPTDRNAVLPTNPCWTDPKYKHPQTIFGSREGATQYNYSDRLECREGHKEAREAATGEPRTAAYYESYLNHLFNEDYELLHIMAGINHSNGYSHLIFGYRRRNANVS